MKKKIDFVPYIVVFALIVGWAIADRLWIAPRERATMEEARKRAEAMAAAFSNSVTNVTAASTGAATGLSAAPPVTGITAAPATTPNATPVEAAPVDTTPAQSFVLTNKHLILRLTSRGAAVEMAEMPDYPRSLKNKKDHVVLDFTNQTALAYSGIAGLSDGYNFTAVEQTPTSITLERQDVSGLTLRRTVTISSNYLVNVRDEFANRGTGPVTLPSHSIRTGLMKSEEGHRDQIGFVVLGVDTLSGGADGVKYWGGDLAKWFKKITAAQSLPKLPPFITTAPLDDKIKEKSVDWIAAKNKYFVQIIAPEGGAEGSLIQAGRVVPAYERDNPMAPAPADAAIETVAGHLQFNTPQTIAAGEKLAPRVIEYYVGPKKYDDLRDMRRHQVDVLEFGYWGKVGKILLVILEWVHNHVVSNYGVAIMLLTLIVRTVFWPLTHKSTVSMKRMAKLQPEMTKLREKYKDNPKKLQTEMIAFTRANKINPLAGCLPMLIQMPVFIALFVVLRSAIEMRYAPFLWIPDLSEPERIFEFGFSLPVIGDAFNFLPLAMAASMYVQMKITPTAGDPAQQRMMMIMMPIMMVFMLYTSSSGLCLYWTTSNLISIGQQIYYKKYMPDLPPVVAAAAPAPAPAPKKKK